jgi:predicted nucleotidyltransferase component of viral defense system
MKLHEDNIKFIDAINETNKITNVDRSLIEKDYYLTLFLKEAKNRIPGLLFKGGTSLSKWYHIIDRFSEDIDLTLDVEHFHQSNKRKSVKTLIEICDDLGLKLLNREQVEKHTHGIYNCLKIEYPIVFKSNLIEQMLIVEMTYIQKTYPSANKMIISMVGETISNINNEIAKTYELDAFEIQTQSLERTFIDKVFALCDYYISNRTIRNSRHIYDLYKISKEIDINSYIFKKLVDEVRTERKSNKTCYSVQEGTNINNLLSEIITKQFFKNDFEQKTIGLLNCDISYEEIIVVLNQIISSNSFAN